MTNTSRLTESERLYVVETKLDNLLTAVEKTNDKIDELVVSMSRYATKAELDAVRVEHEADVAELKLADDKLLRKHTYQIWLVGTSSAAFGSAITVLINMAFN